MLRGYSDYADITLAGRYPAPNDYSISANPVAGTVPAGSSVTTGIATTTVSGAPHTVTLAAAGLPSGATASFSPASVTSGSGSTLTIATTAATPLGTYPITITGTGGVAHTANYTLTVTTSPTPLTNGVAVTASGAGGSQQYWKLDVPAGQSLLTVTISGGTGDADLYLRRGSLPTLTTFDCRPYIGGNAETCTVTAPAAGTWFVMLHGFSAYSGVTLKATYGAQVTPALTNNVWLKNLAGNTGSQNFCKLTVPAGQEKVTFRITGGAGNADLYIRLGSRPTTTAFDCRGISIDNSESCTIDDPVAGDYYVMVNGTSAFERLILRGAYSD